MDKFKVTLAQKVNDRPLDFDNKKYFVQPKLDGIRCYINKDGAFSRNHKEFKNVDHILAELQPLFAYAPELTLDGELYNHELKEDFNKIVSLVRKQTPTGEQKEEARELIQFHNYDVFDAKRPELKFLARRDITLHIQYKYKLMYTLPVETHYVGNSKMIQFEHNRFKEDGYEGSMVRENAVYEQRRSYTLQKVKDWSDTEITITGFVEGKGKFANGLGKFIGKDGDGRTVEVPWPTLTIPERLDVWKNRESYKGKELTFEYFERTPAGAYRFPRAKTIRNYE